MKSRRFVSLLFVSLIASSAAFAAQPYSAGLDQNYLLLYKTNSVPSDAASVVAKGTTAAEKFLLQWRGEADPKAAIASMADIVGGTMAAGGANAINMVVDRDIANAITIAMIANVIEVNVILFITFSPSLVSQSVWFSGLRFVLPKELFTCYLDPSMHVPTVAFRIR